MNLWYKKLKEDYLMNITSFLEYITSSSVSEIQGQEEPFYAIMHLCIDNNDDNAIRVISKGGYLAVADTLENFLFDNEKERTPFLSKYNCGELTLWGKAISLQCEKIVSELEADFSGWTCSTTKWLDSWEMIFSLEDLSCDFLKFYSDTIFPLGDDLLFFMLFLFEKEELAEKLLNGVGIVERKDLLVRAKKQIEEDLAYYSVWVPKDITIHQIKVALNRMIDIVSRINASNTWDCFGIIESIEVKYDDTTLIVKTSDSCYEAEIDTDRNCCEIFGGYIICEDDITNFVGAALLKITLTDVALNNYVINKINSIQNSHHSCDFHNIQFINFETSKGILQFVVYNCHNGYYGHDVIIRHDGMIIYEDRI